MSRRCRDRDAQRAPLRTGQVHALAYSYVSLACTHSLSVWFVCLVFLSVSAATWYREVRAICVDRWLLIESFAGEEDVILGKSSYLWCFPSVIQSDAHSDRSCFAENHCQASCVTYSPKLFAW